MLHPRFLCFFNRMMNALLYGQQARKPRVEHTISLQIQALYEIEIKCVGFDETKIMPNYFNFLFKIAVLVNIIAQSAPLWKNVF
jgi:hypothetical protein